MISTAGRSTDDPQPSTRAIRQLPELGHGWIAFVPRRWKAYHGLWADLSAGALRRELSSRPPSPVVPRIGGDLGELDDLFYLPPVCESVRGERDVLAAGLVEGGTPVLLHRLPGEPCVVEGVDSVIDLGQILVEGDLEAMAGLDPTAMVVWPLIPGLGDHPDVWDEGLEELARAGVSVVLPLVVEINPRLRRQLAEGREDHIFDALFHGEPPSEYSFARHARRVGLESLPERTPHGFSVRVQSNRWLAGKLALAAELWLRLNRPVVEGQALLRAARGAEQSQQDLAALARERNLKVLDWLDARSIATIHELVGHDRSQLIEELRAEYLEDPLARRLESAGSSPAADSSVGETPDDEARGEEDDEDDDL